MAMDPRKRQRKLERRKARERAKRKPSALSGPRDLAARIERAANEPILHSCTTSELWDGGMSKVLMSRELNRGNVAFAVFLLDTYCLGVKDVMFDVVSRDRYDRGLLGKLFRDEPTVKLAPEAARKLVEGAVDYANRLGLPPHRDYRTAKLIFGDIDAGSCDEEFVYGQDAKPLYIAGPNDSSSRCSHIINLLSDRCGPDGFHYIMPLVGGAMIRS